MPGIDVFHDLLNNDRGDLIREGEVDRLCGTQVAPQITQHPQERVLIVRQGGDYYIETVENAAMAASADPDFVVAIPISRLRLIINRSVN
jgi:hypothetical protein